MPSRPSVPYGQSPYRSLAPNEGFPSPQTEYRTLPDTGRQTGYMVPVPQEFVPSTPPSRVAPLDRNYLNPEPKKFDDGGEISRRYALDVLRATGSSNPESRKEYRALKKDARANGLSGQDMRLAARQGAIDRGIARIMPALSDEIIIEDEPIDLPAVDLNLEIPTDLGVDIKSLDDYIDMSGMSFNKAFGKARGYGLKEFI